MTTVSIVKNKKNIVIMSDSRGVGSTRLLDNVKKIIKINKNLVIGFSGEVEASMLFCHYLKSKKINKANELKKYIYKYIKRDNYEDYSVNFIIILNKQIFIFYSNVLIKNREKFYAIGSGQPYFQALYNKNKNQLKSMKLVHKNDIYTNKKIKIVKIKL